MRVIFLDVDGVLNSKMFASQMRKDEGISIFNEDILDRRALANLAQIVREAGATIVLSSSWRKISSAREALVAQLAEYGLAIHSDTPYTGGERGDDITAWFSAHRDLSISSYVILDDDSDMGVHLPHLVQTRFHGLGLERKHVKPAVKLLLKQSERTDLHES